MESTWFFLMLFGVLLVSNLALLYKFSRRDSGETTRREFERGEQDRHTQYNELISEVSTLLAEKVEQVKIRHELTTARAVQEMLVPAERYTYESLSVSGKIHLPNACGGDWWYHSRVGDQVCLWIGDVTGHGVPSALVASACRAIAGTFEHVGISDPALAMTLMNKVLYPMITEKMCVTAICLSVNCRSGQAKIVNASHPSAISIKADGNIAALMEALNPPLGTVGNHEFKGSDILIREREVLLLVTDGVLEFPKSKNPIWSLPRFMKFCAEAAGKNPQLETLISQLERKLNSGTNFSDDIAYVAIQRVAQTPVQMVA
ncbi:MAG: hypothetical protein C5B49_01685 [Bdellovibrio sp.]|nr:MAG: hypothetical protein C5B49_01685 [Bdellovibrio sp.]